MQKSLSRNTPAVTEIGGDEKTPILCYERKDSPESKCYLDFKKQRSRPQLVKSASVQSIDPANIGVDG